MDLGIRGRVALVGGSTAGIGLAVARTLLEEGARVAICGRDQARLDRARSALAAAGGELIAVRADLGQETDISALAEEVAERLGPVSILVNNTGGPPAAGFDATDDEVWLAAFRSVHLLAVRLSRAVLPGMRAMGWGRIVTVSSYSVKQPIPNMILSNSLRLGVLGWAKSLADEVAAEGICVNTVCPGWTSTARMHAVIAARAQATGISAAEAEAAILAGIPAGRMAEPEEIAQAVAFLCSDCARYITGVALQVDGGIVRGPF